MTQLWGRPDYVKLHQIQRTLAYDGVYLGVADIQRVMNGELHRDTRIAERIHQLSKQDFFN